MTSLLEKKVSEQLSHVLDPEIRRPITELDMVEHIDVSAAGLAKIRILLTVAHCPLRNTIVADVKKAAEAVPEVKEVQVQLSVMTAEQRATLKTKLRGNLPPRSIPFNETHNLTKVYAVVSGKGGVGKSTVTANVAAALTNLGLQVGVVDADIHGFSQQELLGVTTKPTRVEDLILPPIARSIKVISIGMFLDNPGTAVAWRGPMLHRAIERFLTDVHFGDIDVLLLDLPPGTGDIAISVSQLLPHAELLLVTTPQHAAVTVAERAGAMAVLTGQKIAGVIENMSAMYLPDGSLIEVFSSGGGKELARRLSSVTGSEVPLLGSIPLDIMVRECADRHIPAIFADSNSIASKKFSEIASILAHFPKNLAGKKLNISPA